LSSFSLKGGEDKERRCAMPLLGEKEIRAYQTKRKELVCPVCASDEERADPGTEEVYAEDIIHDTGPLECVRCKKKIKQ